MHIKFNNYIVDNNLFTKEDKLLVAISGGVDSMALLCLLWENGYNFGVAHCNFQLRGEESEADEQFVERFASFVTDKCHKKRFDTEGYALEKKIGTQEAARDLRYAWFEELRQTFDYQYILTAHHASDSVETMLFNLSRGTGLKGLTGIKSKNGYLIRPLLFASKMDILSYVKEYKIAFREDSSNETDKYARNLIRHSIVPKFKKLNTEFEQNALNTIDKLNDAQNLIDFIINKMRADIVSVKNNQTFIPINKLKELPAIKTVLFELIKEFNFNEHQIKLIIEDNKTGNKYVSKTHELLIDRTHFIIQSIENQQNTEGAYFEILENVSTVNFANCTLNLIKSMGLNRGIIKNKDIAQLNYQQLIFPLKLRYWQLGDRFQPIGMNGKSQLISDYFQQQKLSEFDKKQVLILENGDGRICWIVGFRLAEPFKLLKYTKEILTIKLDNLHLKMEAIETY